MYDNFTAKFDWYLKADDDSFIIMENLKHMLRQLNPGQPVYLGGRSMTLLKNGYNGGGAGRWFIHIAGDGLGHALGLRSHSFSW